ncbi:MAG TPA: sn-glycerol-3-phosphate ABC transporter ATP-binding protein UgpC [Ideonella sp.]|nr:sn-glycerol-3-phosphate ABC transporter ATP-binding protein UgpC [Ideonella sp.]
MATVEIQDAAKSFGSTRVIRGVSIDIRDGEFVVLVGPSGCGKSTLLRMIAGLEGIDSGEIRIGGRRVNGLPPKERDIAMVFQNYALYPHLTVADNLAFSLKLRQAPQQEIEQRVAQAAKILGLEPLLARLPKQLSGGQRQRVAMGRAIVRDPQVFLFDEPLSNLDAKLRVQMRTEIRELHQRLKATTVYVTHDQVEAMTLGDRIAVFNAGRIEQVGPPMQVYQQPASRFVAGFLGSPRMNLLPVRSADAVALSVPGGWLPWPEGLMASGAAAHSVGVRPEHLHLASADALLALAGEVQMVEHLGDVSLAYVRLPGLPEPVARKLAGGSAVPASGDHVHLAADPRHLIAFDAVGRRLLHD